MLTWCVISSFILFSCQENSESSSRLFQGDIDFVERTENAWWVDAQTIQGTTQGTTFTIKTSEDSLFLSPFEISQLLANFDQELSGYIDTSLLSEFNGNSKINFENTRFFKPCYEISYTVFEKTNGLFDPSVFPLVRAWGFFKNPISPPSKGKVDSILTYTGFTKDVHHTIENGDLVKLSDGFQLDFNAVAQGYSTDVVADLLDAKGQKNYYIEIGGELRLKGKNSDGNNWIIGIDLPSEKNDGNSSRELENYLSLTNVGLATSGSYRKFYEKAGKKYSHTLHPKTGYPVEHNLLSVTVIAENAALADAYATAFMVMGVKETMAFISNHTNLGLEVYLLFENTAGRIERVYSKGMEAYFLR
jgi:FAD:protein FMN transferase